MKMRSPNALVVELGRIAGRAEPPPLDDADAVIDRAVLRATPAPEPRARPRWALACAFAATAAAMVWWLAPRASVAEAVPSVLRVTLPTGDRVIGVAGAQFDVEKLADDDRRLRVHGGLVLFDVAHVVAGQRFQVVTDQLTATAKGTVFSVEADAFRTRVRVYEGVVEVDQAGVVQPLLAGASWDSATQTTAIALQRPAALADSVDAAIRARIAPPPVIAHVPPPVTATPPPPVAIAPMPARELPPSPVSVDDLFVAARADIDAGKLADALAIAKRVAARGPLTGPWWQVIGDATRGLGRTADAADAFDNAARTLAGAERSEAGYSAAYLHFHDLHEPVIALTSLIASQADAEGSPLEERALGLRAQILVALGRRDEARAVAVRYIARFPRSDLQTFMLALTR